MYSPYVCCAKLLTEKQDLLLLIENFSSDISKPEELGISDLDSPVW